MTPAEEIRSICEQLGRGGQSRLARLLTNPVTQKPFNSRTVRKWLAGKSTPWPEVMEQIRKMAEKERSNEVRRVL